MLEPASPRGRWHALAERFAPGRSDPSPDPDFQRRASIATSAAVLCAVLGVYYTARFHLVLEEPIRTPFSLLSFGLSILSGLAFLAMRTTGKLAAPVQTVIAYVLVLLSMLVYAFGGSQGPGLYWYLLLPAASVFIVSARVGLLTFAVCQIVYAAFFALQLVGYAFPMPPAGVDLSQLWFGSICSLTLTLFALVVVFERTTTQALGMLQRANVALERSRNEAHEANQSKSEFLARVSHEIRTPMTAILGFADLLASQIPTADPASDVLRTIRRNAGHLLEVINDILDLSSIEAGRLAIEPRNFDPVALARDVALLLKMRAEDQSVALVESHDAGVPPSIRADPRRLKQILINLVGNSIKFSAGGQVQISVRMLPSADASARIRFEVRDTGIGMTREQLEQLFEPFRQAEASTLRRFGGTGLGLSISKRLCERMGGVIHADSRPGEGSRFCVDLPVERAGPDGGLAQPTVSAEGASSSPEVRQLEGRPRILFADDVPHNCELVAEVLRRAGADVTLACDGVSALAEVRGAAQPFDAILLDLEMPGADGFEVARILREEGQRGPILALSARAMTGEDQRCREAGFDALIPKPIDFDAMFRTLASQVTRGTGARAGPEPPATATPVASLPDSTSAEPEDSWGGIARLWEGLVSYFVPLHLREEPAERSRAQIVVGLAVAPVPLILFWALILPHVLDPHVGKTFGWMMGLTAPMLLCIPFVLKRSGSPRLASHLLVAYVFVLIGTLSYFTGAWAAPGIHWLVLLPVATPVLGLRGGFLWTALCLVLYAGFYALEQTGTPTPNTFIPEILPLVSLVSASTLHALITALMFLYARTHRSAIDQVARTNHELDIAQRAAERASRIKSEFIASVSHEIRTPMTAIMGFSELLAEEWLDEPERKPLRRSVDIIHRNGRHLLSLINDLLDLSRIEAGRVELERIAYSPEELCHEVLDLMRVRAEAKGLDLRLRVVPPVPAYVEGDPTRVRQILLNLVGNALKFTQVGHVEVRLRAHADRLGFEVEDTGIGLTPAEQLRLFEPFQQGAREADQGEPGSGLGLAISRLLCELMGGSIEWTSSAGEGSCFRVSLGAPAAVLAKPLSAFAQEPTPPRPAPSALACRVLLAEDGPDNRVLITRMLCSAGAQVQAASNGAEALRAIEAAQAANQPFDVVLMDMQMPVLDGYDAVRELRRRGLTLPVIALTAHAFREERLRCLEAGCDAFATKPIRRLDLIALVRHWSGGTQDALASSREQP